MAAKGSNGAVQTSLCSPRLAARGTHRWQSERFAAVGGLNASQPAACSQGALTVGSLRRDVSVDGFLNNYHLNGGRFYHLNGGRRFDHLNGGRECGRLAARAARAALVT